MEKKGIGKKGSHVGIVISFVIFIIFLVFVFSILQPKLNFGENKQSVVDYLRLELVANFSGNFTTVFVNATDPTDACVKLSAFLTNASLSSRIIVQNESSVMQDARVVGNDLEINKANMNDFFFKVYESDLFSNANSTDIPTCNALAPMQGYFITLESRETQIFEQSINNSIQNYNKDYNGIKNYFSIAKDTNFGFIFKDNAGALHQPAFNISQGVNVYTDEFPILYVGRDGYIKPGFLTIYVW